jgi:ABC transporter substrate binding protein
MVCLEAEAPMRRRDFIKGLGGSAAAWPLAARAQQTAMPVIGIIGAGSRSGFDDLLNEFRLGLKDFGYVEGQTVAIDYAFAAGRFDQLSQLASDLARRRVAIIISTGVGSGLAAKSASSSIPHVFLSQDDPVKLGFVESLMPRTPIWRVSRLEPDQGRARHPLGGQTHLRDAKERRDQRHLVFLSVFLPWPFLHAVREVVLIGPPRPIHV